MKPFGLSIQSILRGNLASPPSQADRNGNIEE
jgi:hypothetical protein